MPDEEPSSLERVLIIADNGSGVSWELDMNQWHFINPELTVHLHREAVGEWICLDAQTAISPGGVGLATSVLPTSTDPWGWVPSPFSSPPGWNGQPRCRV